MKEQLVGIFLFPGTVYDSFKERVPAFPALVAFVVSAFVFVGLSAFLVSDEQLIKIQETQAALSAALTTITDDFALADSDVHTSQEALTEKYNQTYEETRKRYTTPDALLGVRIIKLIGDPIAALLGLSAGVLLLGLYFTIAGKLLRVDQSGGQWLGFALWSLVPMIPFWALANIVLLVNPNTPFERVHEAFSPFYWFNIDNTYLVAISIPMFYSMYIQYQGLRSWSDRSTLTCALTLVLPWLVIIVISVGISSLTEFGERFSQELLQELS